MIIKKSRRPVCVGCGKEVIKSSNTGSIPKGKNRYIDVRERSYDDVVSEIEMFVFSDLKNIYRFRKMRYYLSLGVGLKK